MAYLEVNFLDKSENFVEVTNLFWRSTFGNQEFRSIWFAKKRKDFCLEINFSKRKFCRFWFPNRHAHLLGFTFSDAVIPFGCGQCRVKAVGGPQKNSRWDPLISASI